MTKKEKALKIFKCIGLIVYILITAFMISMLCAFIPDYIEQKDGWWRLGGALSMIISLISALGYIIPIILGIVGAVMSSKMQNKKSKRNCIIMIVVPILTTVADLITYLILLR